ncbi:MAG: glycosyltransferase family 2 protein [candidate division Zixibacteria bacterium]|nr:glycosyltransferase family 2 protein [candidate division Zixibacteria bacterium]
MNNKPQASIIIPVFNEEAGIENTINRLLSVSSNYEWEIIAVNDSSTDNSRAILNRFHQIRILDHSTNRGYGAALKTGIKAASSDIIVMFDADGQHNPSDIPSLLDKINCADMVSGWRSKDSANDWIRKPGKYILKKVADILVENKIPDLNCGLRAIKRELILNMLDLLPDGFSFSTTSIIAFYKLGYNVAYVPITTDPRIGQSTVKQVKHGPQVIMLIIRLITLFSPLRIFLNVASGLFLVGIIYQVEEIARRGWHIVNGALLLVIAALLVFLFGLIADQISELRLGLIRGQIQKQKNKSE